MCINEVSDIVDFAVNHEPKGVVAVVLSHLVTGEGLVRHGACLLMELVYGLEVEKMRPCFERELT